MSPARWMRELVSVASMRVPADGRTSSEAVARSSFPSIPSTKIGVAPLDTVADGTDPVSSTRVRTLLEAGAVADVRRLLGRPYAMDGLIAKGDRMGRKLGFPTINLKSENELYPRDGVYVTRVLLRSFERTFDCVTNIGRRPTVYEDYATTVESYIFDFSSDVYGEPIRLSFFERLRDEMVFPSMRELTAQIRRDVESTRLWFLSKGLA